MARRTMLADDKSYWDEWYARRATMVANNNLKPYTVTVRIDDTRNVEWTRFASDLDSATESARKAVENEPAWEGAKLVKVEPTVSHLAPEQEYYLACRVLRDMTNEQISKQMPCYEEISEAEYMAEVERIYSEANYNEHMDTYHAAEQRLIDWAHDRIRTLPQYAGHRADMEMVFTTRNLAIREKLIDTCLRLKVD